MAERRPSGESSDLAAVKRKGDNESSEEDLPKKLRPLEADADEVMTSIPLTPKLKSHSLWEHPVPLWARGATFYHIFVDRFFQGQRASVAADSDKTSEVLMPGDKRYFKTWGSNPAAQGYHGGDLWGVADKIPYMKDLGVDVILLTPIFMSASNHRYHTYDYTKIDPLLGGLDAFRHLISKAHDAGMRIVLDGVFNHTGRGFWPFHHVLENGCHSPYQKWFYIHHLPIRPYDREKPCNYDCWQGIRELPVLNLENQDVQNYLLEAVDYWTSLGVDGWRIDAPEDVKHKQFFDEFRRVVRKRNRDGYIVGEIWKDDASEWLSGTRFDAVTNYSLQRRVLRYIGGRGLRNEYLREHPDHGWTPLSASEMGAFLDKHYRLYVPEVSQAQLNLLSSHDTARVLWALNNGFDYFRLTLLMQVTLPGSPCIYYGDELGLSSDKDPGCRESFPWHTLEEKQQVHSMFKDQLSLRRRYKALREGSFSVILSNKEVLAFSRHIPDEELVIVFNRSADTVGCSELHLPLPGSHTLEEVRRLQLMEEVSPQRPDKPVSGEATVIAVDVSTGSVLPQPFMMPPRSAVIFKATKKKFPFSATL